MRWHVGDWGVVGVRASWILRRVVIWYIVVCRGRHVDARSMDVSRGGVATGTASQ